MAISPEGLPSIYDYPSYFPITSPGCPGDLDFYLEKSARLGGPVLEVGCGLGRLTVPLAMRGLEVVGIDNSESMLGAARGASEQHPLGESIQLKNADMRTLDLGTKFKTIIIPYRAFLHLETVEDQLEALARLRAHLQKGGYLVFNVFDPDLTALARFSRAESGSHRLLRRGQLEDGVTELVAWATTESDPETQLIEEIWTYDEVLDGSVTKRSYGLFRIRYVFRYEMEHLLVRSGFVVEELLGGFLGESFRHGREQIWVCRQPS